MKRLLSDSKLAQFLEVIKKEPVTKQHVKQAMNWSDSAFHDAVCKARQQGCDIWVIHRGAGRDTLYLLKDGPDLSHLIKPNPMAEILAVLKANKGDSFTRREMADLMDLDLAMVSHYICKLKKRGEPIKTTKIDHMTFCDEYMPKAEFYATQELRFLSQNKSKKTLHHN